MDRTPVRDNVIDFVRYRAGKGRVDLPLFARPLAALTAPPTPVRPLSGRAVEHRTRMLAHLRVAGGKLMP